jgi:NADH:ubiquinone oxidoreductase subunit F (NADH-binding)
VPRASSNTPSRRTSPQTVIFRHLLDLAGGTLEGRSIKAIFPGASNTVLTPEELEVPMDFDSMRQIGSGLGAGGFAVFDDSACMVKAAYLYSRFLYVEPCGQCPACKFGTGEVTKLLKHIDAGGASDQDLEAILMRAKASRTDRSARCPRARASSCRAWCRSSRTSLAATSADRALSLANSPSTRSSTGMPIPPQAPHPLSG